MTGHLRTQVVVREERERSRGAAGVSSEPTQRAACRPQRRRHGYRSNTVGLPRSGMPVLPRSDHRERHGMCVSVRLLKRGVTLMGAIVVVLRLGLDGGEAAEQVPGGQLAR
jgi:hypothetical protein